jgi:O-antigen ligase
LITIGIVGVLVCYGYLFIVYNNEFFAILNEHGINNMGRDLIYAYFVRRTKLSPTQMGWGMAGVAKVVENMDRSEVMYMAAVRGVHNDILKIYINFGFVGSLIWYALNLIYFPVKFMNEYGKKAATIYMALILYLFITYLTDNTESYFVCQVALLLIPITEYLKEKNRSVYCEN